MTKTSNQVISLNNIVALSHNLKQHNACCLKKHTISIEIKKKEGKVLHT